MFDRHFVGRDLFSAANYGPRRPVSRITLFVDDANTFTAGDDTGMELTAKCPYATEAMAKTLLSIAKGAQYTAYEATAVNLDPAAELGDGVTVDGIYSVIAQMTDNGDGYPDIAFPGEDLIEEEYPGIETPEENFERKIASTRSLIAKTAEEIKMGIYGEGGLAGQVTELKVGVGAIEGRVEGVEGEFAAFLLATDGFYVLDEKGNRTAIRGSSIDVTTLNVQDINFSGVISFGDLTGTDDLLSDVDTALAYADEAQKAADSVANRVKGWTYSGSTKIDGSEIKTGTVTASKLRGGTVKLLSSTGKEVGGLDLTSASSADFAVALSSTGALKLAATGSGKPSVYLEALGKYGLGVQWVEDLDAYYVTAVKCGIMSASVAKYDCGSEDFPWKDIYSLNDPTVTSDANMKYDGEDLPEKYVAMFDLLQPKRAKYKAGTSGRFHPCYFAQDVKAAMDAVGIDSAEFGGWVLHRAKDGTERQMLRYSELDPIRDAKIKQMDRRLKRLEELHEVQ